MVEEFMEELAGEMKTALQYLAKEFSRLPSGRVSVSLLDGVNVEYYGSQSPLTQVASLSVPEPRMIVIKPWDATLIPKIERAIRLADPEHNPVSDGKIIRLTLPELTQERRREIARKARAMAEEGRVRVRRVRRDYNDLFKKMEKDKELSEDDLKRALESVQKQTDAHIDRIDKAAARMEKEILSV